MYNVPSLCRMVDVKSTPSLFLISLKTWKESSFDSRLLAALTFLFLSGVELQMGSAVGVRSSGGISSVWKKEKYVYLKYSSFGSLWCLDQTL